MGMPVVTVASGGMPVVEATFGTPVTEAANGYGVPVTKVVGKPGLPVVFETIGVGGGGGTGGTEAQAFLARTSGLDATHTNAYIVLIDGLVADGIWNKFDMLHVYATQNSATALLNLVSASYAGTAFGSPVFTADRGFTGGADNNSTVYIDTGFNASTAPSPKSVQTSAHISAWSVTTVANTNEAIMGATNTGAETNLMPRDNSTGMVLFRINSNGGINIANATQIGHYLANRSDTSNIQGYKNGGQIVSHTSRPSQPPLNLNYTTLSGNTVSFGHHGSPYQCAMASIGSSLNATEVTNFYSRLRTYMTAVGVP